jgi:tetratricopeptide (TPR) repeat protein
MVGYKDREGEALSPPLPDPRELTAAERREICERALARAEELRRAGRLEEGIALLLDAAKYKLELAKIHFRLGNLYFDSGDLERAEQAYLRAVEEDPKYASAYHNLGVVYRRQGKIGQSVKMLKKARRLELRYPRPVKLSQDQKAFLKRMALPMISVPILGLIVILAIIYLIFRFR